MRQQRRLHLGFLKLTAAGPRSGDGNSTLGLGAVRGCRIADEAAKTYHNHEVDNEHHKHLLTLLDSVRHELECNRDVGVLDRVDTCVGF